MTPQAFRQLMRLHPAAVNIIATGKAPHRTGMTVSAFMSLGVEPPSHPMLESQASLPERYQVVPNDLALIRQILLADAG
jgi:hypothetical protein